MIREEARLARLHLRLAENALSEYDDGGYVARLHARAGLAKLGCYPGYRVLPAETLVKTLRDAVAAVGEQ